MGRHARLRPGGIARTASLTAFALALAAAGVATVSAIALSRSSGPTDTSNRPLSAVAQPSANAADTSATPSTAPSQTATAAVRPVSLAIPAIHVQTTLQLLGLTSDGALAPPTNLTQAGWYTGSAVPGQTGPAVLAGHVDSTTGPAVFFRLRDLIPGDEITIALSSGGTVRFAVTQVDRYAKDAFPTASVYGPRPDSELRLITCGGSFANGHYLDNVVVYATLTASTA